MSAGSITALVETLVAAGCAPDVILAAVRTAEAVKDAEAEAGREKARARWHKWKASHPETNVGKRLQPLANDSKQLVRADDVPDLENKQTNKPERKQEDASPAAPPKRAARLPADWTLPDAWRDEAIAAGVPATRVLIEAKKMLNWSLSAKGGAKLDWHATWRNWFQESIDRTPQAKAAGPPAPRNAGELSRLQLINGTAPHEPPRNDTGRLDAGNGERQAEGTGIARRFAIPADQLGRIAAGDVLRRS